MNRPPPTVLPSDLAGYEVVIGVCGGIAAYKVCEVVSTLVQRGAGVTVAMTRAARRFVGATTFQALTGRRVLTNPWHPNDAAVVQHISVTAGCDVMLIAPATANMIGKMASGVADDLVSTLVISASSPVVLAPAMNDRMWNNPVVRRNVAALAEPAFRMVEPGEGWLACRSVGKGRMAEPQEILNVLIPLLTATPPKGLAQVRQP